MKQQGNEWADNTAKRAVQQQEWENGFPIDQQWVLTSKIRGTLLQWAALPKLYIEKMKKARTERLQHPSNPNRSKHGQGKRSQAAKQDRTILFNMAMKAKPEIHFMTTLYTTNKIHTREFNSRQQVQKGEAVGHEHFHCPLCQIATQQTKVQTKEHIFSGECVLTKDMTKNSTQEMQKLLQQWRLKTNTVKQIINSIQQETESVNKQDTTGDLGGHAQGCCLIGLWKNKTVQQIVNILVKEEGLTEELAMERVKDLSMKKLQHSVEIYKRLKDNKKILETEITEMEMEIGKYIRGEQSKWPYEELPQAEVLKWTTTSKRMKWIPQYREMDIEQSITNMMQ